MSLQTINTTLPPSTASPLPVTTKSNVPSDATTSSLIKPVESAVERSTPVGRAELQDAIKATNDFVKPISSAIEFSMDDDTREMVVKVIDTDTKEVIRQIPSEEMLSIAKALDKIQGLLIKQSA